MPVMTSFMCLLSFGLACEQLEMKPEAADAVVLASVNSAMLAPATTPTTQPTTKPTPPRGSASKILARVQSFYDRADDVTSEFEQTYLHPVYRTKKVSKGKLRVKKPGMMVWDYAAADNPDVWINGDQLWAVERANKQVFERSLKGSDFAGADKFLFGERQLLEDFMVKLAGPGLEKRYGLPGHTSIRLRPKRKNPHYKELVLVVDDDSGRVDAFVVRNADESTNHFVLSGQKINQGLATAKMVFHKPAGYVVVRE